MCRGSQFGSFDPQEAFRLIEPDRDNSGEAILSVRKKVEQTGSPITGHQSKLPLIAYAERSQIQALAPKLKVLEGHISSAVEQANANAHLINCRAKCVLTTRS